MTAIWNEAEIKWRGQTYRVRPTFALMQSLEQINPAGFEDLIMQGAENRIKAGTVCEVIAAGLQSVGVRVSAEDVFNDPDFDCGIGNGKIVAFGIITAFADRSKKKRTAEPVTEPVSGDQ